MLSRVWGPECLWLCLVGADCGALNLESSEDMIVLVPWAIRAKEGMHFSSGPTVCRDVVKRPRKGH